VRGNGFGAVFFDANAWIYLIILLPLLSIVDQGKGDIFLNRTVTYVLGASLANALLTLIFFHVFAHQYVFTHTIYLWIRDMQFGEITFIRPGAWRVFLQSQVWLLFVAAWFFLTSIAKSQQNKIAHIALLSVTLSALFISFSRSNWIGLIAVGITGVTLLLYHHAAPVKRILAVTAGGILGAMLLMIAFQRIPPIPAGGIPLRERLAIEAAGSSRMNQLSPLMKAIAKHPVIGSGFGTAVTYISADPRIVARSLGGSGIYTTSAFEWGFLDIWLKIGLVGLAGYLWLIAVIGKNLWDMMEQTEIPTLAAALLLALVGISTVNITSPYLNHPLGIGLVLLCLITVVANIPQNLSDQIPTSYHA
jgi:O-antigen ligase